MRTPVLNSTMLKRSSRVEVLQHVDQRLLRLLDLLALHAAGGVEHDDHVFGDRGLVVRDAGRGEEQEVPSPVAGSTVAEEVGADLLLR